MGTGTPARVLQIPGKTLATASVPAGRGRGKKHKSKDTPRLEASLVGAPAGSAKTAQGSERDEGTSASSRPAPRVLNIPGKPSRVSEKRRFMSDNVSSIRSKPLVPKQKPRKGPPDQEDTKEFRQALKDVLNFVMPQLGKQERKQYEKAKIRALGGTLDKPAFEPYAALQRRQKREETARQLRLEQEKELGVSLSASQQRAGLSAAVATRRKKEALQAKKRRKESNILAVGARERRGMVIIPKSKAKAYG
mmetsp:Transcript_29896/g.56060  ORF Transcript_29896/g.56060 Transcript_29896/m.56060 type:complete len:250 (+) Transcript_29896:59-808(+)